jgi:hypothetical protein
MLPTAFRRAVLIVFTALACTACSSQQASRSAAGTDVACVRSVEATGRSFLQAVAHCQQNPFNTLSPTMLDLSGAPDLQKQAFASGYYNRDLPASNFAEAARLQALQSGLTAAMAVRQKSQGQKQQGKSVKLSSTGCMAYLLDVPHEAFLLGPAWDGDGTSPPNQYLTPQENDCLARQRDAATHGAAPGQPWAAPSPISAAPLPKDNATSAGNKSARDSRGTHAASPHAQALIL